MRHGERSFGYDSYKYLAPITPSGMCARETQPLYYVKDSGISDACTAATSGEQYSVLQPIAFSAVPQYVGVFNDFNPVSITGLGNGCPASIPERWTTPSRSKTPSTRGNERYLQRADSYRVEETSQSTQSYDITPNFTVYVQGVNLTGENEARYAQRENQFYDQSIFERRYFFGSRFHN